MTLALLHQPGNLGGLKGSGAKGGLLFAFCSLLWILVVKAEANTGSEWALLSPR
jgi:hypothetical protein